MNVDRRSVLCTGLAAALAACDRAAPPKLPAYADAPVARDGLQHVVFGIHPLHNPQLLAQKYGPLMAYLSRSVPGTQFELEASIDYAEYERKLREGRHAFSLPNPLHAVMARSWGYKVIARMGDNSQFRGIFIVRKDSPVTQVQDLRGQVVAYPAPTALAAAMMPQLYLHEHGLDVEREVQNRYVGTHNSSIMNAYLGQSAASATWPAAWAGFQKANPKEAAELKVLWETPTLIQNAVIVRQDVPADMQSRVAGLLAGLGQHAEGRTILQGADTDSFVLSDDREFDVVLNFLREYKSKVKKEANPVVP